LTHVEDQNGGAGSSRSGGASWLIAQGRPLRQGVIGVAALDVTDPEPIPMHDRSSASTPALIVPHIASFAGNPGKMAQMAAANLLSGLRGQRLATPVNPKIYS
jgi:glyoxylate reductase